MSSPDVPAEIYLDNAATTFMDPSVAAEMADAYGRRYGNAVSLHRRGVSAAVAVEKARVLLLEALGDSSGDLIFTGGGTEANNLALYGAVRALSPGRGIVVSSIEHPSVLAVARDLEASGYALTIVPVNAQGRVSVDALARAIDERTALVSVMQANNEIGVVQPIGEIGRLCRSRGVLFHTDACQSFMRMDLHVRDACVDMVTINAHKLHGPRGVGALYVRAGVRIRPILHGGSQEGGMRPGTHNTEGIMGFAKAVSLCELTHREAMAALRDYLIDEVERAVPDAVLNGPRGADRLCTNAHFTFRSIPGVDLAQLLSEAGVQVSSGAACVAARGLPSHVMAALGRSVEEARSSVRFSLSRFTTRREIDCAVSTVARLVRERRAP